MIQFLRSLLLRLGPRAPSSKHPAPAREDWENLEKELKQKLEARFTRLRQRGN